MIRRINGNPTPQHVRVHEGNIDNYIGCQVMYFTKGQWEISYVVSIAITRGSILISNTEDKENTSQKKRLNIPQFRGTEQIRNGRYIYVVL
jgi:hypothetical protein